MKFRIKPTLILIFFCVTLTAFLFNVFRGNLILSQSFSFGFFALHYYGIIVGLAVASGFYLAKKRAYKFGIDYKVAEDLSFWVILTGLIGARAYHVFSSMSYYQNNQIDIFKIWNGGLSIYGAILGGLVGVFLCFKSYKLNINSVLNWLTPSLILGQIIGRFGNLFNYEAYGYPTNLPWKMFVPENFRSVEFIGNQYFHPWFMYEQFGLIVIWYVILHLEKPHSTQSNNLFVLYILLYNILRFNLELLRIDSTFILNSDFRLNSVVSALFILSCFYYFFKFKSKNAQIS